MYLGPVETILGVSKLMLTLHSLKVTVEGKSSKVYNYFKFEISIGPIMSFYFKFVNEKSCSRPMPIFVT